MGVAEAVADGPATSDVGTASPSGQSLSLDYFNNTVTEERFSPEAYLRTAPARCGCSFCPTCTEVWGLNQRKRLIPVLKTFEGIIFVTYTVDPMLFPGGPRSAYDHLMANRCIAKTSQDIFRRRQYLSRRYYCATEWHDDTGYPHFHVLYDSDFIDQNLLVASWGKHRPVGAGPALDGRPAFGWVNTVEVQPDDFAQTVEQVAMYVTKAPRGGFPLWVLEMAGEGPVRRYTTSRRFWPPRHPKRRRASNRPAKRPRRAAQPAMVRIAKCGNTVVIFVMLEEVNQVTGELLPKRTWVGEVRCSPAGAERLWASNRFAQPVISLESVPDMVRQIIGEPFEWVRLHSSLSANVEAVPQAAAHRGGSDLRGGRFNS